MFELGKKKGTVRFVMAPSRKAARVAVAGDFNGWEPLPMRRQDDGTYVRVVPIARDCFEYKFIVEDEWVTDPDNSQWAMNRFHTFNSVGRLPDRPRA